MADPEDVPEPATADSTGDPFFRVLLWQIISSLPEKPQMVLILRLQQGPTYPEIAVVVDMPVNTTKNSMNRERTY